MTHADAQALIDELHKNKWFRPTEWEKKFLEDLSFNLQFGNIKVSEKQSKCLQKIYRKAMEDLDGN
jgi:hypothetical protein